MARSSGPDLAATLEVLSLLQVAPMDFSERLVRLRKERALTQQHLADKVGVHLTQIFRYESAAALPTFEVLRGLAVALAVTTDELVFDKAERGPDETLKLQFEAINHFDPDEKAVARAVLESLILKHEARRWASPAPAAPSPSLQETQTKKPRKVGRKPPSRRRTGGTA